MKLDALIRYSALVLALALAPNYSQAYDRGGTGGGRDEGGAVFTMDNAAAANHLLAFRRDADGKLKQDGSFATGGRGTGSGLGSQGAIVLSSNGRWLFACNAGSDEISVFLVAPNGAVLTHKVSSGGKRPISLALHRNSLFVLNAGGQVGDTDNVTGFAFFGGRLYPMPESTRALSADNTNPAQVGFSSDGETLVVTEKDTGVIDTFKVDNDGAIDAAKHFQSSGQTPFGFAVRGYDLIVTEAFGGATDASAASSYELNRDGDLEVISPTVATTETSACWVVVTGSGRFAYTANTGSGTISGYRLGTDGALTLLNADGVTGITGANSSPADMTLSLNSKFLYCRNGNGTISAFRVHDNGSLLPLNGTSGVPAGSAGLAGR
jgi:6-phosphogluconolactonase (cycloisomerase 2 family)